MSSLNPDKALIFRIVHRGNIPWILDNGLYASSSENVDPGYVSIGNPDKRVSDAGPMDTIAFLDAKAEAVALYLKSGEAKSYGPVISETDSLIDGFQSPLGMELLATVDWLMEREGCSPDLSSVREGIKNWPGGEEAGARKQRLFPDRLLSLALNQLAGVSKP